MLQSEARADSRDACVEVLQNRVRTCRNGRTSSESEPSSAEPGRDRSSSGQMSEIGPESEISAPISAEFEQTRQHLLKVDNTPSGDEHWRGGEIGTHSGRALGAYAHGMLSERALMVRAGARTRVMHSKHTLGARTPGHELWTCTPNTDAKHAIPALRGDETVRQGADSTNTRQIGAPCCD